MTGRASVAQAFPPEIPVITNADPINAISFLNLDPRGITQKQLIELYNHNKPRDQETDLEPVVKRLYTLIPKRIYALLGFARAQYVPNDLNS